jgi:hypothetical protein
MASDNIVTVSVDLAEDQLRMAVTGRPQVDLALLHNKYIAFSARIKGTLQLETNLPFPFDKIVAAVSRLVWEAIKAVLNVFLAQIQIVLVLVPPRFESPKQETGIALVTSLPAISHTMAAARQRSDMQRIL